jgi:hypothetical protein
MASLAIAIIKNLGPMLSTGSSQNESHDITITTAAGIADLQLPFHLLLVKYVKKY